MRLKATIIFLFAPLAGCIGLDFYTDEDGNGVPDWEEMDPEGDADADNDADSDSDSNNNLDPIAVDSITPAYGTNAGGTAVIIRGGPFNTTAQVTFGGVPGQVANNVSTHELRVFTPVSADTDSVDVVVTTNNGQGTLEAGFQYFLDGTGMAGSLGVLFWQHFLGDYWTNATDQGYAWWALASPPESRSIPEIFYAPSLDTCVSNYNIEGFYVDDIGVTSTTLRVNNRAIELGWDATQNIWSKTLEIGDFVQAAGYDLDEIPANAYPAFSVGNFARTPSTFLLASPNLNTLGYLRQSDLNFQWSQASADEILLHLVRIQDNGATSSIAEEVTCRISNNNTSGQFTVPPSIWSGWGNSNQDGSYLEIRVGAITHAAGSLPFNNSRTGVVGGYWVIGASLMQ